LIDVANYIAYPSVSPWGEHETAITFPVGSLMSVSERVADDVTGRWPYCSWVARWWVNDALMSERRCSTGRSRVGRSDAGWFSSLIR